MSLNESDLALASPGPARDGETQVVSAKYLMSLNGHLLRPGGTSPPCFLKRTFKNFGIPLRPEFKKQWITLFPQKSSKRKILSPGSTGIWKEWPDARQDFIDMQKNRNSGQNLNNTENCANENSKRLKWIFWTILFRKVLTIITASHSGAMWKLNVRIMSVLLHLKLKEFYIVKVRIKRRFSLSSSTLFSQKLEIKFYQNYQNSLRMNYPDSPLQCLDLQDTRYKIQEALFYVGYI